MVKKLLERSTKNICKTQTKQSVELEKYKKKRFKSYSLSGKVLIILLITGYI